MIENLENRRLLAVLGSDVTWGNDGLLADDSLVGVLTGRFLTARVDPSDNRIHIISTFNNNGTLISSFQVSLDGEVLAAVDSQNRIVIVNTTGSSSGTPKTFIRRYRALGIVDDTFGIKGLTTVSYNHAAGTTRGSIRVNSLVIGSGDSIVIGSGVVSVVKDISTISGETTQDDFYITRLTGTGALDATFANSGKILVNPMNQYNGYGITLLIDAQNRIIIKRPASSDTGVQFIRYTSSGTLDTSFGTQGIQALSTSTVVNACTIDTQGRLYVLTIATSTLALDTSDDFILRLNPQGQNDSTWGTNGKTRLGTNSGNNDAIVVETNGKIVAILGNRAARLTTSGLLDTTFDSDGLSSPGSPAGAVNEKTKLLQLSDGSLITNLDAGVSRLVFVSPVALGNSGTLYLNGSEIADHVTLTSAGNVLSILFNGFTTKQTLSAVTDINARLGDGQNVYDSSDINILVNIQTGSDNDTVQTGDGSDSITTNSGNDSVLAGGGSDTIAAGAGSNHIDAGTGNGDISAYTDDATQAYTNTITGTAGNYIVNVNTPGGGVQTITLSGGTANVTSYSPEGSRIVLNMTGNCSVTGAFGPDTIITGAGNDYIQPGIGKDSVITGDGNDTIAGDDYDLAGQGDVMSDYYDSGAGNDLILDGFGNNTIIAGAGNDSVRTGNGNDSITGGEGKDTLRAGGGNDTISGDSGRDKLYGQDGNDLIFGGSNNDTLFGGNGADQLIGNRGNDLIISTDTPSTDIDTIDGGKGIDSLFGDNNETGVSIESILTSLA